MTIDEIKKESFYQQLSEGQKAFVLARCDGKEPREAAKTAWKCTTEDSAASMAARAMKNVNIKWLINRFFGVGAACRVPTAEELAAWNWEKAQKVEDPAVAIKFAQNVARILGYEYRPAENTPTKPVVDDGKDNFDL